MPRMQMIDPATDTGPGAEILNGPLKQKQINIFKGLAVNAGVLQAFLGFAGGVKTGALTDAEHEIIALVTGQKRNCGYCLAAHTQIAKGVGIDEDMALEIRQGSSKTPKHQSLIDFVNAILDTEGFVSDSQLDRVRAAGYDDAAIIEMIGAIAVNTFTNLFNHVAETQIDFPVPASV
ncbi:MAG: carboxymuconolactone decarboxylase family protein [Phycisphaerales bacterium]|nr:carboxymuconolactone decarboxylase family protein [Phycisphaerae bacterium]NNM27280.1 carboxymuconolactone decarboxylase family protein [Phycisphaerales bacterium]